MSIGSYLTLALYLLLPLGQLQKLPLGISNVSVYAHDLVLIGLWVYILIKHQPRDLWQVVKNNKLVPLAVFTGIGLFSWAGNYFVWGEQSLLGLGYLLRWVLLTAPLFVFNLNAGKVNKQKLLRQSVFFLVLFGWVQYLVFPDLTQFKYFGWDDHYFRLTGTLLDPNFMGALIVLGLGLEFKRVKCSFLRKVFYLVTLGLTYSRASWLVWLVLLFAYTVREIFSRPIKTDILMVFRTLIRSLKVPAFYFWLIISAVIFLLLPRPQGEGGNLARTASISGRMSSYQQAWQIIKSKPILGVGFNNYRLALKEQDFKVENIEVNHAAAGADNSFLFVWATTGIFGLFAFLWLVSSLQPMWLILPLVVHALFNNTLFFPWVLIYIWGLQNKHES
jgi:O-antigen ligase